MNGGGAGSTGTGKGTSDHTRSAISRERERLTDQLMKSFPEKFSLIIKDENGKEKLINVETHKKDYKHVVNDSLFDKVTPTSKLTKLYSQLNNSYYKKWSYNDKVKHKNIDKFYYFKVKGRSIYFNIARYKYKNKKRGVYYEYRLHAITKSCK